MRLLTTNSLSERQHTTPEGYLVCEGVPIGRCGTMLYGSEAAHFRDHTTDAPIQFESGMLEVVRTEDVVFAPETLASFQGKPVTVQHPSDSVNPDNVRLHEVGTTLNVRRGEGTMSDHIIADLLIKDRSGIDAVRSGMRGVSCGYDATYRQLSPGRATQDTIRGNHVAIVREGRGGKTCYIGDEIMADAPAKTETTDADAVRGLGLLARLFGDHKPVEASATKDAATFDSAAFKTELLGDVGKMLEPIAASIAALKPAAATKDEPTLDTAAVEARVSLLMPDAEVLKPGIAKPALTLDAVASFQREALTAALSGDHRDTVKTVVRGDVATMDAATLDHMIPAAAGIIRVLNDAANKAKPIGGAFGYEATRDANVTTNDQAKAHWGNAAGHVAA